MLDLDTLSDDFERIVKGADGKKNVAPDLAKAYNKYAKGGTIAGAVLTAGGDVSLLESAFTTDNTEATITNMAAKICAFWDGVPKPGVPSHGGTVVASVDPTFSLMTVAVADAIKSCITDKTVEKPYKTLFKAIENVLKTATVTITETMPTTPPSPGTFPETLS